MQEEMGEGTVHIWSREGAVDIHVELINHYPSFLVECASQ